MIRKSINFAKKQISKLHKFLLENFRYSKNLYLKKKNMIRQHMIEYAVGSISISLECTMLLSFSVVFCKPAQPILHDIQNLGMYRLLKKSAVLLSDIQDIVIIVDFS